MHTQYQENSQSQNYERARARQERNISIRGRIVKKTDEMLWAARQAGEIDDYLFRYVNAIKCTLNPLGIGHKSQKQLASKGRMSVRKAQYCKKEAEEKLGLKVESTRKAKGRRQGKNKYYLPAYLEMKSQEQARGKNCIDEVKVVSEVYGVSGTPQGACQGAQRGSVRVHGAPLKESLVYGDGPRDGGGATGTADEIFGVTHSADDGNFVPVSEWEMMWEELEVKRNSDIRVEATAETETAAVPNSEDIPSQEEKITDPDPETPDPFDVPPEFNDCSLLAGKNNPEGDAMQSADDDLFEDPDDWEEEDEDWDDWNDPRAIPENPVQIELAEENSPSQDVDDLEPETADWGDEFDWDKPSEGDRYSWPGSKRQYPPPNRRRVLVTDLRGYDGIEIPEGRVLH